VVRAVIKTQDENWSQKLLNDITFMSKEWEGKMGLSKKTSFTTLEYQLLCHCPIVTICH